MKKICIGMAGAGRAAELHINAIKRYPGTQCRLKHIIARRKEQIEWAVEHYGFEYGSDKFEDLLNDPEIDVIDICTPPYIHVEMIEKALTAGKHVICEKPLCGFFGSPDSNELIGKTISKSVMYEHVIKELAHLKTIVENSDRKFFYAENFIYAPAIVKAAEIIRKKKSRILFLKGEESLKGSSSALAGEWSKNGGGTFSRTGTHPLSAILWLKRQESQSLGKEIKVTSVLADMGQITPTLSEYEHRHIAARPLDVEDCGICILTFSDESRAVIMATDTLLGGSKNYVEMYCNDAVIYCNLTMSDLMKTYFLDEERLEDVYLSEMLPSKTGWNNPFLEDEILRGYTDEMSDFLSCIAEDKNPKSGFDIAYETARITYLAYKSAELGKRINI